MPTFTVSVKWGKQKFEGVVVDTDEPPVVLKGQVFALTGVPPERQKLMVKGVALKDDDWGKAKLKDGAMLLMIGSADELPQAPAERPKFIEDMTDAQLAEAFEVPCGLKNLGNTCYMNATVQCLRTIPQLQKALKMHEGDMIMASGAVSSQAITTSLRDTYGMMEKSTEASTPFIFLKNLHLSFPQFAEKNEEGHLMQQDANECWTQVVRCLRERLLPVKVEADNSLTTLERSASSPGFVDQFMGGKFTCTMKCEESPGEDAVVSVEPFLQLSCFISQDVKFMHTGLKSRLHEKIVKRSPTLDRDAVYVKTSLIGRLPGYLTVQMVRFFYKEKDQVNAKILKDVKFPLSLDVYDLCSAELQQKLIPMRDRFRLHEEAELERAKEAKLQMGADVQPMDVEKPKEEFEQHWFEDDVGSNNSGFYELTAVLTHQGRSSNSGHYVGWARRKGSHWFKFDDDVVSSVHEEDVLKLSGGGDWHTAYVLLYSPRYLPKGAGLKDKPTESAAANGATKE